MPDELDLTDRPTEPVRPKRRGRSKKRHRFLVVALGVVTTLALVVGLGSVWFVRHLDDNVDFQSYDDQLVDRPDKAEVADGPHEPLNILVMGSDTRDGAGNNIDGLTGDGERSDTTILFHLSADRTFAYGVSIPRDTLVDRPDCVGDDGSAIAGEDDVMWNEAFAVGGPACTMQQFEQLTGVRLDNYVKVDFNGFRDMVDAIDGVEVCIPEEISDPAHGIDIPAGTREIAGKEALSYVRARYTLGDGSDIGRIKRQQAFLAAMAGKVVSKGTLARVDRLFGFLDAATRSLQTDFDSVGDMKDVGTSFRSIGLDHIKFVTVPWQYSPEDPNRVEWLPSAKKLWRKVIKDKPLAGKVSDGVISAGDDVKGRTPTTGGSKGAVTTAQRESAGLCA
ncbi:LCP family protein [Nocardioides sp.]|uniref:LCP family protein n=1 Tax=Nocardioides sp. TaxID=35761 RepID=UPI002727AB6C|nr:LCP family protein [Nocardioides sp.]MDO9455345.1 LCP family protein [Nocardioides sp.]